VDWLYAFREQTTTHRPTNLHLIGKISFTPGKVTGAGLVNAMTLGSTYTGCILQIVQVDISLLFRKRTS
jgi:hypothetical protein